MAGSDRVPIQLRISRANKEALELLAKQRQVTMGEIVEAALTGSMWQLSADQIHVTLTRVETSNRDGKPAKTAKGRNAR